MGFSVTFLVCNSWLSVGFNWRPTVILTTGCLLRCLLNFGLPQSFSQSILLSLIRFCISALTVCDILLPVIAFDALLNGFVMKLMTPKTWKYILFLWLLSPIQCYRKSLILLIKRVSVKKLLYSGNFSLGKNFQHRQKVKACFLICVNKLWLIYYFFKKSVILE